MLCHLHQLCFHSKDFLADFNFCWFYRLKITVYLFQQPYSSIIWWCFVIAREFVKCCLCFMFLFEKIVSYKLRWQIFFFCKLYNPITSCSFPYYIAETNFGFVRLLEHNDLGQCEIFIINGFWRKWVIFGLYFIIFDAQNWKFYCYYIVCFTSSFTLSSKC